MKKRIAQIGSFDVENFGDLLFPDVLQLKLGSDYEVDLFSPRGGEKPFDEKKVYPIKSLENKIKTENYSALIIGGGDVIRTDSKVFICNDIYGHSAEPSLELWAYPIILAKKYGIPVILNSVGVTNDFSDDEKFLVKKILSYVDYFSVRDTEAKLALEKAGIFSSKVVPDTVLTIKDLYENRDLDDTYHKLLQEELLPNLNDYIIFQHNSTNIEKKEYIENIISLLKKVSLNHQVLLMPIGYIHNDDKVLKEIYNKNIKNVHIVNDKRKLSPKEIVAIIKHSSGYMGTSMHGAVVSYSYNKKIMILNSMNSKKLHGFANIIDKSNLDVNDDKLLSYIYDKYFENQKTIFDIKIYDKIQKQFSDIIDIINNHNENKNENIDLINFIREFYENKNNQELIGEYFNEEDGFLKRKTFKYLKVSNDTYIAKIKNESRTFILKPSINAQLKIANLKINDKNYLISNDEIVDEHFSIKIEDNSVNIEIKLTANTLTNNYIKESLFKEINVNNELKEEIDRLSYLHDMILSSYKELEEKYCNLLKKKD